MDLLFSENAQLHFTTRERKIFAIPEKGRCMFRLRRRLVHPASGGNAVWQKICQIVTKYPEMNAASSEKNPGNDFELIILKENL